jgi:hypothetical protein
VRSESVSEVKHSAPAIFKLNPDLFARGYPRQESGECRALLVNGKGLYTKFALILYPDPKNVSAKSQDFLKTVVLIKISHVLCCDIL